MALVLTLTQQEVSSAEAFSDGHLELSFAHGTALSVPADEGFKDWEFTA